MRYFSRSFTLAIVMFSLAALEIEAEGGAGNRTSTAGRVNYTAGSVHSVAFSPNGKRIASASFDRTVKVWDAVTGQEALTLKHTSEVHSVAFSPDGKCLASGSEDRTVKVWDASTAQEVLTLKGHTRPVRTIAFSPDGKRLASGSSDRTVKVWDLTIREVANGGKPP